MIALTVVIPGQMMGKQSARGGRAGKRAHMPAATVNAEAWCRAHAMQQVGQQRLQGPLGLSLDIGVPVPPSWSQKRRQAALTRREWVTAKPDLANIVKLVEDAMKGVLWGDDAQIAHYGQMSKRYAEKPETVLTVWQLGEASA